MTVPPATERVGQPRVLRLRQFVRRTTDSKNIPFSVCKYLIRLPQKILKATDEDCIHRSTCATPEGHGLHSTKLEKRLRSLDVTQLQQRIAHKIPNESRRGLGIDPEEIPKAVASDREPLARDGVIRWS